MTPPKPELSSKRFHHLGETHELPFLLLSRPIAFSDLASNKHWVLAIGFMQSAGNIIF